MLAPAKPLGSARNWDRLPNHYFDCHSFAWGVGDWDTETAKAMAHRYVDEEIAEAIEARLDFGVESTCPEGPGRELVGRTKRAGYRVEGVLHRDGVSGHQRRAG